MNSVTILLILLFSAIAGLGLWVFISDRRDSRERGHRHP
jgi:hypothetical protein